MFNNYVKVIAIRKEHYKDRGIYEGITYVLMSNGTWKEINRYTWADTHRTPAWYRNDNVMELGDGYTIDDVLLTIYSQK